MARGTRSPFGELVFQHRRRLGVTQGQLANQISVLYGKGDAPAPVSERTIAGIERRTTDPGSWRSPRPPTVQAIALGLRIEPGTPNYDAFLDAALEVQRLERLYTHPLLDLSTAARGPRLCRGAARS